MTKPFAFETLSLHGGQTVDPSTLSRGVPVYRTSSYLFKNAEHAANLFALKELGNIYSRLMNPTHDVLGQRVSLLEGGAASVALASGTAAIFNTIINLASAGDEIVSAKTLRRIVPCSSILPQLGITVKFVKPDDPKNFGRAVTPKTRAIFIETIGNPALDFTDVGAVAKIAHEHGLPLIVDATFTTPYLLRTIEHGADIVVNSLTKWMGGHGTAIGGIVTDSGKFDWTDKKFGLYNEPDPNYHGLKWAHDLPAALAPIAFALRLRTVPLRNLGACTSPDNAWIFLQGLETLPLRMERHCSNALAVALYLKKHPKVAWVRYPGLADDPSYPVASRVLKLGFGMAIGRGETATKINSVSLISHLNETRKPRPSGEQSHSQLRKPRRKG
jgi:O-acetylhomoserine (thiol)-lyase